MPKTISNSTGSPVKDGLCLSARRLRNIPRHGHHRHRSCLCQVQSTGQVALALSDGLCVDAFLSSPANRNPDTNPYKYKSRLLICGNFASWSDQATTTTHLGSPPLRLILSLAASTWSSDAIISAFLDADSSGYPTAHLGQYEHCETQHSVASRENRTRTSRGASIGQCFGNPNPYNLSKKYGSTPPICMAVRPPFVSPYFPGF